MQLKGISWVTKLSIDHIIIFMLHPGQSNFSSSPETTRSAVKVKQPDHGSLGTPRQGQDHLPSYSNHPASGGLDLVSALP